MCPSFLIEDATAARNASVTFGYDGMEMTQAETYSLDPDDMWVYEGPKGALDLFYAVIKVKDPHDTLDKWEHLEIEYTSAPIKGDPIRIIHHPLAGKKAIGQASEILAVDHPQIIYDLETQPGSSGGALLNQEYKLVGMHVMKYQSDDMISPKGKQLKAGVLIQAILGDLKKRLGDEGFGALNFSGSQDPGLKF